MPASRRLLLAALAAAGLLFRSAFAQAWPAKPIRAGRAVPARAAAPTSLPARRSQKVAATTGWTFVDRQQAGRRRQPGRRCGGQGAADGYTIVLGQTSNLAINPTLYAKLPYDPVKDLAPIVLVANAPLVMVTGMNTPYKTLADAVNAAKAKPDALNFASPGNGTVAHLTSELFQKAAGVQTQHVPYKGAAQALTDVISGTVDLYMSSVPTLLGQIKQGKLRAAGGHLRPSGSTTCRTCRPSTSRATRASTPSPGSACWRPPARRRT